MICIGLLFRAAMFAPARDLKSNGKLAIISTLFPTYDFARQIAGDKADVFLLLPPGVESHSYEPKPGDIMAINRADVFIFTGKYMEPWADDLLSGIDNKQLKVVDASLGINLLGSKDEDHEDAHHLHGAKDPHIWLDLQNAQIMVDTISDAISAKDPANKSYYMKRAAAYKSELKELDEEYKSVVKRCKFSTIVYGGHFAFGYLAKRYGLTYVSPYEGFSPNAEPGPQKIAALIETLRRTGMKNIFFEELIDPKVARSIAGETGANLLLLHGAHNISKDELSKGKTFYQIMEDNLKRLKNGLEFS